MTTSTDATITTIEDAERALVDPVAYADGRFEQACALLRRESPMHRVEVDGFRPFWALTKYDDVHSVERQGDLFHAGPRYRLFREVDDPKPGEGVSTLVRIDVGADQRVDAFLQALDLQRRQIPDSRVSVHGCPSRILHTVLTGFHTALTVFVR